MNVNLAEDPPFSKFEHATSSANQNVLQNRARIQRDQIPNVVSMDYFDWSSVTGSSNRISRNKIPDFRRGHLTKCQQDRTCSGQVAICQVGAAKQRKDIVSVECRMNIKILRFNFIHTELDVTKVMHKKFMNNLPTTILLDCFSPSVNEANGVFSPGGCVLLVSPF